MSDTHQDAHEISRRAVLKSAAIGGAAFVAGGTVLTGCASDLQLHSVELLEAKGEWLSKRVWCLSGNKVLSAGAGSPMVATTAARQIYRPRSAEEISCVVRSLPANTAIACVGGGHESSNVAAFASSEAIVLDMAHLKSIEFRDDDQGTLVTVGAGVVFRELVEALKVHHGALPVGTGPGVGVVGFLVNGGLSGYFSRRLGLLGQRVEGMTIVTAAGDIRVLTRADELLTAMLGAGSALAIVVDVTIRMANEKVVQLAEQRVMAFESRAQAVEFSRGAVRFLRDRVLSNPSVSVEVVVTGTKVIVATLVFYDSFQGSAAEFVKPLEELAAGMKLPVVAQAHWTSWYETASALWPVINGQKGDPLATLQHCFGTEGMPADQHLDFVCDTVVGQSPLDEAELSIIEIRTLGGAALSGAKVPSGNCQHTFFVNLVTLYDAKPKTPQQRQEIVELTKRVVDKARLVEGLNVDFSGTHSQADDLDRSTAAAEMFGSEALAQTVKAMKSKMDPDNRLRFHPFAKFL